MGKTSVIEKRMICKLKGIEKEICVRQFRCQEARPKPKPWLEVRTVSGLGKGFGNHGAGETVGDWVHFVTIF